MTSVSSVNLTEYGPIHILLFDTERERQLNIGKDYPFEPLKAGECIVPEKFGEENATL